MRPLIPFLCLFFGCADATTPVTSNVEANESAEPTATERPGVVESDPLLRRAAHADAVFAGTVIGVEHRMSVPDELGRDFPVTFIRFSVDRAFKGVRAGDEHVVRLFGGPRGDGTAMILAHQPLFQVGDRDVVFVRDNGLTGAPFVDGTSGRVRLVDGRALTHQGTALFVDDAGLLRLGGRKRHAQLDEVVVGDVVVRPSSGEAEREGPDAMPADAFLDWLGARVARAGLDEGRLAPSADPEAPVLETLPL